MSRRHFRALGLLRGRGDNLARLEHGEELVGRHAVVGRQVLVEVHPEHSAPSLGKRAQGWQEFVGILPRRKTMVTLRLAKRF
eukprot:1249037-Prymnesium_polylepis.1